jgi:hypothetical protein
MDEKIPENKLLYKFLVDCDDIITMLVHDEGRYIFIDFAQRDPIYRTLIIETWEEVRGGLQKTQQIIVHEHDRYKDLLSERGLTGKQLRFKLHLFERFKERFVKRPSSLALRRLLGPMDTLLKSLSSVFLPLDPVGEFKEMLEHITKSKAKEEPPPEDGLG